MGGPGKPAAAAFPTTTAEVTTAVRIAAAHRVPIVPRGAGSSLCGGSSAIDGCLVLCLERMDRVLEVVDAVDQMALLEPGVINAHGSEATRDVGLCYSSPAVCSCPCSRSSTARRPWRWTIGATWGSTVTPPRSSSPSRTRPSRCAVPRRPHGRAVRPRGGELQRGDRGRRRVRDALEARRLAIPALERLGATLLDDVAVPRSRIPDLVGRTEDIAAAREVTIGTFGHAGDGNMHPTIVIPHGDADAAARGKAAFHDILEAALDLGGTITGEHGIGGVKQPFLEREVGAANLDVQRGTKRSLDPHDLFNPGKWL